MIITSAINTLWSGVLSIQPSLLGGYKAKQNTLQTQNSIPSSCVRNMLKMFVLPNYSQEGQQYIYIKTAKKLENYVSVQIVGIDSKVSLS